MFGFKKKINAPWEKYYTKEELNILKNDISMEVIGIVESKFVKGENI